MRGSHPSSAALDQSLAGAGLEPVRSAWNLRCFRRGRLGGLTIAEERIEGIVAGLNESGDLVVGDRRLPLAIGLDLLA